MADETSDAEQSRLVDAVRAEQVRLLYAEGLGPASTLFVSLVLAGILVWQRTLGLVPAAIWCAAVAIHSIARVWLRAAYLKADPPIGEWRRWARRFVIAAIASGLIWGAGMPFLLAPERFDLQVLVIGMMVIGTYGMVGSAGIYLPAFSAFFLPWIPIVVWFALQGDPLHLACMAMQVIWLPSVAQLARRYNRSMIEALQLRFENVALAEDLRAQKHAAEQSNLAKSRFLASASHDLRQPVHALGVFVGALRGHRLGPRSRELVDHIDGSISALDGLFSSLLDVSRLDAGAVEPRPARIRLQPVLERICRELAHEAEAKRQSLRVVATSAEVRSDPVLLERILRNLIGNAVRHSRGGRILVGVRRRARSARIEVLDTGPGIAPELHEAVFEEFYQLDNPDRDRSKGLGLGLPIVRRLCGLLGHPLAMDSVPGRGSRFAVEVPRLAPSRAGQAPTAEAALGLRTAFILAIDDEQAIRLGMVALLEGWGHRVLATGGAEEAIAALSGAPAPDLIVCDYRLKGGEDGVSAIGKVQAAIGAKVPAILVTGDTGPENIRQAMASGYPLLHKPVSHARLRAAITSLLRRAQGQRLARA